VANLQLTPTTKEQSEGAPRYAFSAAKPPATQFRSAPSASRDYDLQNLLHFDTRRDFDLIAQGHPRHRRRQRLSRISIEWENLVGKRRALRAAPTLSAERRAGVPLPAVRGVK
jgi:hypothetical protein